MSSTDNHLWLQLWRDEQQMDFHQNTVNNFLTRFWLQFNHRKNSRVFVPMCGKSLDMIWLANQGHKVIGVELSSIAVKAFFQENGLKPIKRQIGKFMLWKHGNISILCGDYFSLSRRILGHIDMVYDRAALTALPADIRKLYVVHMELIVPKSTNIFLLTIEDVEEISTLEQAHHVDEEVETLYSKNFHINLAHIEVEFNSDPESQQHAKYKLYQLSCK